MDLGIMALINIYPFSGDKVSIFIPKIDRFHGDRRRLPGIISKINGRRGFTIVTEQGTIDRTVNVNELQPFDGPLHLCMETCDKR